MQTPSACQPIPLEANCHIAEHIQVILAGFSEQSKVRYVIFLFQFQQNIDKLLYFPLLNLSVNK